MCAQHQLVELGAQLLNMDRLCDYCEKIEFHRLNKREENQYLLPSKRQIRANVACPFCRLARSAGAEDIADDGRQLYASWVPDRGFSLSNFFTLAFLNEEPGAESLNGMARYVQHTISPGLVNKWMALCESHHGHSCAPAPHILETAEHPSGIKILRMIDVRNQCIVRASPGCRYVALSYMWGQVETVKLTSHNKDQLMAPAGLLAFRNRLPRTINDAIDLLFTMGEQYLWVDAICLLQDDSNEMGDAIGKMHLVYRGALFTILAAAGRDANAGLPGVHYGSRHVPFHFEPYRRVLQYVEEVLPGIRMTALQPLADALRTSQHLTRGWTMQEHILSHRLLIFTNTRVIFQCNQNCWSEDTIYDDFPLEENIPLSIDKDTGVPLVRENDPRPFETYASMILGYCGRQLTQESDTLNAAAGFLNAMSLMLKCDMLAGLPTGAFDLAVLFFDAWPDENKTGIRRKAFPSWSWAGWKTNTVFMMTKRPVKEINAWLRTQTYIVWHKRSMHDEHPNLVWDVQSNKGPYDTLCDDDIAYSTRTGDNTGLYGRAENKDLDEVRALSTLDMSMITRTYPLLHFWAHVIHVPSFERPDPVAYHLFERTNRIRGKAGELWGGMQFNDPKLIEDMDGPYECVLLSQGETYKNEFNDRDVNIFSGLEGKQIWWILLIVWDGTVAERRGLGFIYEDCVQYANSVWKEILLG